MGGHLFHNSHYYMLVLYSIKSFDAYDYISWSSTSIFGPTELEGLDA